jgi:hypothetical protein
MSNTDKPDSPEPSIKLREGWTWLWNVDRAWSAVAPWSEEYGERAVHFVIEERDDGVTSHYLTCDGCPDPDVVASVLAANSPEFLAAAVAGMAVPPREGTPELYEVAEAGPSYFHACAELEDCVANTREQANDICRRHRDRILASGFPTLVAERDRLAAELARVQELRDVALAREDATLADMDNLRADLAAAVARAERAERERDEARRGWAKEKTLDIYDLLSCATTLFGNDEALRLFSASTEEPTP